MSQGVRMIVMQQIVGNHDPRVLSGSTPDGGICWGGGEEIVVTPELADNYERSGIARRVVERKEATTLEVPENAMLPAPKKRVAS